MSFVLSKLLIYLIYPLSWVTVLLVAALVFKNPRLKWRLLVSTFIILLIFSNPLLIGLFAKAWDIPPSIIKPGSTYSCVIVLGGFAGETSPGKGEFNTSADRFIQTIELYDLGRAKHILMTGGSANLVNTKFREANWVAKQFKNVNIPDSALLIEDQSRNTLENASFSKKILESNHLQPPFILVTSAFHMRRATGIFKRAGIDVIPYPCNYLTGSSTVTFDSFIPDAQAISTWDFYLKEVVGNAVDYFKR